MHDLPMKLITAGVTSVTSVMLAAGIAGSVAAYRTQAGAPETIRPTAPTAPAAPAASRHGAGATHHQQRPRVRWAPCPAGSTLEQGTCVTDVVRTVVLSAPSRTAAPVPTPPTAAVSRGGADGSDHAENADDGEGGDGQETDSHEADGHEDDHETEDHED